MTTHNFVCMMSKTTLFATLKKCWRILQCTLLLHTALVVPPEAGGQHTPSVSCLVHEFLRDKTDFFVCVASSTKATQCWLA